MADYSLMILLAIVLTVNYTVLYKKNKTMANVTTIFTATYFSYLYNQYFMFGMVLIVISGIAIIYDWLVPRLNFWGGTSHQIRKV